MPNATIQQMRGLFDLVETRVLAEQNEARRYEAWDTLGTDLLALAGEADERIEDLEQALLFMVGPKRDA